MDPRHKPLDEWTEDDLQALVAAAVIEQREIEYKKALPGGSDNDKREVAADLTSLGNAAGGWLIYGIEANDGVPEHIAGFSGSPDQATLRLDQIAQSLIEPRLPGMRIRAIPFEDGGHCLVVRVPMSWTKPHAVKVNNAFRFYARNSAGKYLLDFREVSDLFAGSEVVGDRVARFRAERVMRIEGGDTPVSLIDKPTVALHLVPLHAFARSGSVEVREFQWHSRIGQLSTIIGGIEGWRYNLDGLVTYVSEGKGTAASYVQVFRNGVIEAVDTYALVARQDTDDIIRIKTFEQKILDAMPSLFEAQKFLELDPPIIVMLSLVGVKGLRIGLEAGTSDAIDRDVLLIREELAEVYPDDPAPLMHPIIDVVWNACGLERSPNFDVDGNYFR